MTEWDKLWKGYENKHFSWIDGDPFTWIERIKAEGDKLQRAIATGYCGECDIHKEKLEKIQSLGLISLITDMIEDLMAHYNHWQENRDFEGYHKPVKNSDMRAVRKYMEDFRAINKKLKEVLGK